MILTPENIINVAFPDGKFVLPVTVSCPQEYAKSIPQRLSIEFHHHEYGWLFKAPELHTWVAYRFSWDAANKAGYVWLAVADGRRIDPLSSNCTAVAAPDVQDWARRYLEHHRNVLAEQYSKQDVALVDGYRRSSKLRMN